MNVPQDAHVLKALNALKSSKSEPYVNIHIYIYNIHKENTHIAACFHRKLHIILSICSRVHSILGLPFKENKDNKDFLGYSCLYQENGHHSTFPKKTFGGLHFRGYILGVKH